MQTEYKINPALSNSELQSLFSDAWGQSRGGSRNFTSILKRSLAYICAYAGEDLVGFVNLAWDGDKHAFLLDPTVRKSARRNGIGTALVLRAANEARARGAHWLHVDFEPHLTDFYRKCGLRHTEAGLMKLR
ncbi:MAG: GNAT family N-acetyltransferase [Candidatus Binataceae bacterium]